jgi:hypothetical protein
LKFLQDFWFLYKYKFFFINGKYFYTNYKDLPSLLRIKVHILKLDSGLNELVGTFFFLLSFFKKQPNLRIMKKKTTKTKYNIETFCYELNILEFSLFVKQFLLNRLILQKDFTKFLLNKKTNKLLHTFKFFFKNLKIWVFPTKMDLDLKTNMSIEIKSNTKNLKVIKNVFDLYLIPLQH